MRARVCVLAVGLALWCQPACSAGGDFYDETVLRTLKLTFAQANWSTLLTNNKNKDNQGNTQTDIPATLTVDGVVYEGVGVRYRGNMASYQQIGTSPKKSFNINIDYTDPNLDLMGYKTLNLLNSATDATFMREVLYTNTCRRQIPSAKANFVRLEINGVNWGLYANVQQLNGEFIRDWFPSNEGTRWRGLVDNMAGGGGGGMPGGGGTANKSSLTWLGTASSTYAAAYGLKSSKQANPWTSLINTCNVLNNTTLTQLPSVLDSVLNVDRALWLCAFEVVFADEDGYVFKGGSDYYLYYEPETGQVNLIQFDGNESMNQTTLELFYRGTDSTVPIMYRLVGNISQYRQRYLAHVRTIMDLYLTDEYFAAKLNAYQALIDQEVKDDTKKLYTYSAFTSGVTTLKSFPKNRRSSLLSQQAPVTRSTVFAATAAQQELQLSFSSAPEILAVGCETAPSDAGEALTITATVGTTVAVYGVQLVVAAGPFALFTSTAMTEVNPPDANSRAFSATLPIYPSGTVLRYYVQATGADRSRTVSFSPPGAEYQVYTHVVSYPHAASSAIVFNEVMASNQSTLVDPQGEFDDWIELKNVSDQPADLAGMYLSDRADNPLKWEFPEGTRIEAGGYLLVWADEDGSDSPGLHANFKLSAKGETLWLFDTAANRHALLDSISFESLGVDQTVGRSPDGQGPMQILAVPSPLEENAE